MGDSLAGVQEIVDVQARDRADRDGGPHPPVQPVAPVPAQEDRRRVSSRSSRWTCRPTSSGARNTNALGQPRSWTDHLLWHHAAHTVDLFQYQTGEQIVVANAIQGPKHPELGIAMDMSIQLKTETGKICTLSLSFNNDGPLGTFFRYIGDTGTYIARYDDLVTGKEEPIDVSQVDVSMNGIELQDREFVAAIVEGREPNSSVAQVLPCYVVLDQLQRQLDY